MSRVTFRPPPSSGGALPIAARGIAAAAFLAGLAALAPAGAAAHPHVWIEAELTVPMTDGLVRAIELRWRFDEAFGAVAIADFDANGDGRLDAAEAERLAANSRESLRDFAFFTHLAIDGRDVPETSIDRLEVRDDGRTLHYTLTVPLPRPVDPTRTALSVALYDPSYYTDVALAEVDPVRLTGGWPMDCRPEASEDKRHAIYFGMVYPVRVHLRCGPPGGASAPASDTAPRPVSGADGGRGRG